ncbi:MAG: cytidine deaminase [Clostridia bacterium]|nr:cytidine deaminase [Clostridia bacterium]
MEQIWKELYQAAKSVQNPREISERIYAGGVAAAIESTSGKIYTGVCVDTSSSLGICAERNAMFNMITNGENEIRRVLAIMPDGKTGAPCGACREFMAQLMMGRYREVEIMLDYDHERIVTLEDLTPEWWL